MNDKTFVSNILSFSVVILLYLLPFVVFPVQGAPYEMVKIVLTYIGIDVIAIIWLIARKTRDRQPSLTVIPRLFILYIGIALMYTSLRAWNQDIVMGLPPRFQGYLFMLHMLIFFVISRHIKNVRITLGILVIILFAHFIFSLFIQFNPSGRAVGLLGESNALGATVLFLWPCLFWSERSNSRLAAIALLITIGIIFLSGSRSALIGFVVQLIFWLLIHVRIPAPRSAMISFLLMVFSLAGPFLTTPTQYENRADIWKIAFVSGLQHPVLGGGIGNISNILHQTAVDTANANMGYIIDSSHNIILDWWVQGGIVGVIFFIILLTGAMKRLIQAQKIVQIMQFLGIFTVMLFNPANSTMSLAFWWLLGQGYLKTSDRPVTR